MDFFNRWILRKSDDVIVLDRFMGDTMMKKLDVRSKLHTMPPWPHEDHLETVARDENPFRKEHGLQDKFVFMYSGNHAIGLPLNTFLDAAITYKDDPAIVFLFVGGGVRKKEVEEAIATHDLRNMISLPYQPIENLRYSLSTADVHLVGVGDDMVGVVHPCKIYGAMAVGRPILLLGPDPCHVSDLVHENSIGWHIGNGDADKARAVIREIADTPRSSLDEMGQRSLKAVRDQLSKDHLCGMFCDVLEGKS
jgi:glycosyltransferase involved in cell wall biosynthesis